jgi:hypothetical protein
MLKSVIGVFIVLHGLVHLLYVGQSQRLFELEEGMLWPEDSWAFSKLFGYKPTRRLASISCLLAALGFMVGGVAILMRQAWWRPVVVAAAAFSSAIFVLFWDGKKRNLNNQGAIAILINLAILVAVLIFQWPDFGF